MKSTKVLEVWVDQKQTLGHVSKKTSKKFDLWDCQQSSLHEMISNRTKWRNSIIKGSLIHQSNWENHRIKLSENRKIKVDNLPTLFIDI